MAVVTGLTAARMAEIEAASVVSGAIVGDNLILTKHDATTVNAGNVRGPAGPTGAGLFVGQVVTHALASAPTGWLACDGEDYDEATYPALAAALGSTYNTMAGAAAPAAGRFRVPNLKGRVPVGRDAGQTEFDALAETGGAKTHTLSTPEMPSHTHVQDAHNHTQNAHSHDFQNGSQTVTTTVINLAAGGGASTMIQLGYGPTSSTATNQPATATNQNTGGGGAHNNLQPYGVLNYAIYAGA